MRLVLQFALLLAVSQSAAQRVDWAAVDINPSHLNPRLPVASLTPAQRASVRVLLLADSHRNHTWECEDDAWLQGLSFFRAPLGRPHLVYVSPGVGCMRGGQGANAALWLVDLSGPTPTLLAGLAEDFGGWGLGTQPHRSHGLHDVVTGSHISAFETGLSYFRFDGRHYDRIAGQDLRACKMPPARSDEAFCLENGRRARNSARY